MPEVSPVFVARMEDLLDLYAESYDPKRPVVCVDEYPLAQTSHTRAPQPMTAHHPRREDYEYTRHGSSALFAAFQPLAGWRTVRVRDRRTTQDFAAFLKHLVDGPFAAATRIRLVLDNLNTHLPAALYATYPAAEARRIARKLEWHYTPVHGSWLNMIEIEWSVLAQQCLPQRLPDRASVEREVTAWVAQRNAARATVRWRFATTDARERLARLYPLTPSQVP